MKKEKGFTLIELLAVIVILGLLIAIAIPSITKYIIQSRKKTLVLTIENYLSSVVIDVNDKLYNFTADNTIYAVPINCISLEKGGKNPFGEWMQVDDDYFAYVLVQWNSKTMGYTYGFTFKDSSGYGMYPTVQNQIEDSGKQIEKELSLKAPKDGYITRLTSITNWNGFSTNDDTKLIVLEAIDNQSIAGSSNVCSLKQKEKKYHETLEKNKNKYNVGNEVCFGEECFYIIKSDTTTVTLFAKNKITPSLTEPKQDANADGVSFSKTNYWHKQGASVPKEQYGVSYPVYAYDENSSIYPYLEAYKKYLKEESGIYTIEIRLISSEEVKNDLQCTSGCKGSPYLKIFHVNYVWWLGDATSNCHVIHNRVYQDDLYSGGGDSLFNTKNGIRPILVINKGAI